MWVFPTGSGTHEATKVIFEGMQMINILFVVVVVEVIDSQIITVVSSDSSLISISSISASVSTNAADFTAIVQLNTIHLINVGTDEGCAYNPSQLNASIGDIVRFNFLGRNHSVMQSDLALLCTYNGGFNTGLNQFNPFNISGKYIVDFQVKVLTL